MINPVSSNPAAVDSYQQAAPRSQVKPAPQERAADTVALSAKAKAGGEVDGDGDGH